MFSPFTWRCLALGCALAFAAEASALTLAQAQQRAVERSRQLAAQGHAADAARDMAVAAAQLPDPVLKAGVDNLPVSGADRYRIGAESMTMRRIGVMQELTSSDKRRWRAARFESEAARNQAAAEALTASIQRDTAIAWLDRYHAERMNAELLRQAALSRDEIVAAEAAYRGGRSSQAGLLDARASLLALEDRATELALQARNAAIMLARWTGEPVDVALDGSVDTSSVAVTPAALEATLEHHPQVAVLTRQAELAQAEASLARANRTPDWSVEVALQQRGPGYPNMLSFGVSVPLQWDRGHRQERELSARLATAGQALAERDEALREHVAEVRSQLAEWQAGRERIARFEKEVLPLAAARTEAMLAAYRGGKAGLADVLAARRSESEQRLQALQLERDNARVWAQLTYILPVKGHP
ncbi:TolC family protein [Duganella sp. Root1480D1]|uniref:TolC family protein n=1 Tax=Duganella sp. Root1480D1 TaxID=1736471 RepID=UPI0009EA74B5|nr:TolC family protein [Duganella sp. Root1480D1]